MMTSAIPTAEGGSQAVRAQLQLREMILAGELPPGERVGEVAIVEKLGISRTPIRAALVRLEQEGLLEALPHGGFAVRSFSEREVADAIELRGTLEGLLARVAAERGVPSALLGEAREALDEIDAVLARPQLDEADFTRYVAANGRFHAVLLRMADSRVLAREVERVVRMPFASPSAFVVVQADSPQARDMFVVAQAQHRAVLDAIQRREGARAEAIMREHARIAQRNLREALRLQRPQALPGVALIRPEASTFTRMK
ncbi:GntR family transcriptional regulator [Xenophilus azovorans]|uniref:GntR family transcriptional regulator n=1 Tax=Xenophilus azovorans TaxID=151755 RepID=UPI00056FB181|nr:GntR family transcriptional regulator [Xenophilus azovorans]